VGQDDGPDESGAGVVTGRMPAGPLNPLARLSHIARCGALAIAPGRFSSKGSALHAEGRSAGPPPETYPRRGLWRQRQVQFVQDQLLSASGSM